MVYKLWAKIAFLPTRKYTIWIICHIFTFIPINMVNVNINIRLMHFNYQSIQGTFFIFFVYRICNIAIVIRFICLKHLFIHLRFMWRHWRKGTLFFQSGFPSYIGYRYRENPENPNLQLVQSCESHHVFFLYYNQEEW